MRSKEEIKRVRQQANADLKKEFTTGKKPVKKAVSKKFGICGFGK